MIGVSIMRKSVQGILILATAGLLAGCSLHPNALTEQDLTKFTGLNAESLIAGQEPVHGAIGLYEAMARALKYNLDYRVEMMNQTLAARAADVKSAAMLPQAVATAGYNGRDNSSGGYSRSLPFLTKSLAASTSSERETASADITASWNILDFGLSYVRARQAGDEALIAQERKRKVVNKIVEDVRTAYWRAASAQHLMTGLVTLEKRVNVALTNSRSLSNDGALSALTALTYQRELVDIRRQIHELERDLNASKIQLAALMNIPPTENFELVLPKHGGGQLKLDGTAEALVETAMLHRPELREAYLRERITAQEANASLLQLLPGIQVFAGTNIDSNDLLYNSSWMGWGAKASWNAMRLFSLPALQKQDKASRELNRQQSLAMTMAVFTQVHAARARYAQTAAIFRDANDYFAVQKRILQQVQKRAASDAESEQVLIREEMNTLLASVKYDVADADLQNAFANVYATIGLDPYEGGVTGTESVKNLATALRGTWIERGDGSGT
jgi:outer membrane protein TolC